MSSQNHERSLASQRSNDTHVTCPRRRWSACCRRTALAGIARSASERHAATTCPRVEKRGRCQIEPPSSGSSVVQSEERDHVVLIDAITRNTDAADERVAAVDRHAARKDLNAVGNPRIGPGTGAVRANVGPASENEHHVLQNRVVDEIELKAGRERTPLPGRFAERAIRRAR